MELAALALTDAVPGLIGEEALAEREDKSSKTTGSTACLWGTLMYHASIDSAPSPRVARERPRAARATESALALRAIRDTSDGSSLALADAGNQTRISWVDSGSGNY
ncbi:MAG: hypothetical protein DI558_13280 [Corynebacterium propinquum]|nr:MAG: hypothetical protein DI558_13280 [Corynebacterium propinquum]